MSAGQHFDLEPGTPIARAVTRAREAFARADAVGVDAAYRQAVNLAAAGVQPAVAVDHVSQLLALGASTLALRRCDEYLAAASPTQRTLRLLRAEIQCSIGSHSGAAADTAALRAALGGELWSLTADDRARLLRVEALSAANQGDLVSAERLLGEARQAFLEAGNDTGLAMIDQYRRVIAVEDVVEPAVSEAQSEALPQTAADHLLLATALKRQLRYEEAVEELRDAIAKEVDPALRLPLLGELTDLLRLTRQDEAAEQVARLFAEAVAASPDPVAGQGTMAVLSGEGAASAPVPTRFESAVQHARLLITTDRYEEADSLLAALLPRARTERDIATWHLASGELHLGRYTRSGDRSLLRVAVDHLGNAVERAAATSLIDVRVVALSMLGRAWARLEDVDRAVDYWAEAHRIEEYIAARQTTDHARIRMLQAAPDEFDEQVRAATERGPEAAAAVVVAMESARGAMILGRILPQNANLMRDLPRPNDLDGAWRWVRDATDDLPRSQVVWLMHATPDHVYHAIVGRGLLSQVRAPVRRADLKDTVDRLRACWSDQMLVEQSRADDGFDQHLAEIAAQLRLNDVIATLPRHINRIAVVAGGELSDIPFAAMPVSETTERMIHRFALSDLPCLSARRPLHRRSLRHRGDRTLLVSPPTGGLTLASNHLIPAGLSGNQATLATLQMAFESHRFRTVRIDAHGSHNYDDPSRSWIALAPEGPEGHLGPGHLQTMDLRGCATLILGAAETGMAERRGRDERPGFVRAALHAGAASVVSARWVTEDQVAAAVLDRFQHHARYLTRDRALRRAQLDVCNTAIGTPVSLPGLDHPLQWACWTLYGDSGYQTDAGPLRRLLRSKRAT